MKTVKELAADYAAQAEKYLDTNNVAKCGSGYIRRPVSGHVATAIQANFFTAFTVETNGRDIDFIVSRDYKGSSLVVDPAHVGKAVKKIRAIAGTLKRKIKIVAPLTPAQQAVKDREELDYEIRKAARRR